MSDAVDGALRRLIEAFEEFLAMSAGQWTSLLSDEWITRTFTEDVEWKAPGPDLGTYVGPEGTREYWLAGWSHGAPCPSPTSPGGWGIES